MLNKYDLPIGWPRAIAFDGIHLWVLGFDGVSKVLARDGSVVDTFSVGFDATSIVFDGNSLWIASMGSSKVFKLDRVSGGVLATLSINRAWGLAFDGTHIWVSSDDNGALATVTKINAATTDVVAVVPVTPRPRHVAFDGSSIWVAGVQWPGYVTKIRASDATVLGNFPVPGGPSDLAFDGVHMWVVSPTDQSVRKLNLADGSILATFPIGWDDNAINGIAFDGASIWVTQGQAGTVTRR